MAGLAAQQPATYTGLLDPIRTAFAKANGVTPDLFSANSAGAWPNCAGNGGIYTDLAMMASVATVCEECEGKRFQASVLEYRLACRDISEVLAMSVTEALAFFGSGAAKTPAARQILGRMADAGKSVIEHHLAVMAHADWIVDLGPRRRVRRRAGRVRGPAGGPTDGWWRLRLAPALHKPSHGSFTATIAEAVDPLVEVRCDLAAFLPAADQVRSEAIESAWSLTGGPPKIRGGPDPNEPANGSAIEVELIGDRRDRQTSAAEGVYFCVARFIPYLDSAQRRERRCSPLFI